MRRVISTATAVVIAASLLAGITAHAGPTSAFVTIGNPRNAADTRVMNDGTSGYGRVDYVYEISQTAVSIAEWAAFYGDGTAESTGIGGGTAVGTFRTDYNYWNDDDVTDSGRSVGLDAPAVRITFHQAAQYANWLTTGDATDGVYTIDIDEQSATYGSVTDPKSRQRALADHGIAYFLPTEDEWYKAAYYDPNKEIGNGETGGYWLYADGSDTFPQKSTNGATGWNYDYALSSPWAVDSGTEEQNGTFNMMGNVWEWNEGLSTSPRGLRGGAFYDNEHSLRASNRIYNNPTDEYSRYRVPRRKGYS